MLPFVDASLLLFVILGSDFPRTLPKSKHLEMRVAYSAVHRELDEYETPAPALIETKLDQMEDGELKVEALKDLLSTQEAGYQHYQDARDMPDGTIKLKQGKASGKTPQDPEQLRTKLRLLGTMWEMIRIKAPSRAYLKGYPPHLWSEYADWLLGQDVWHMDVTAPGGNEVRRADWSTLLDLDNQIRKHVITMSMRAGAHWWVHSRWHAAIRQS